MVRLALLIAIVGACYAAKPGTGSPCGAGEPCPSGQSCSVVTQTCEVTGGELGVDHTTLDFTMVPCGGTSSSTLVLANAGAQPIMFDITSDVPGVTVTPASGTVAAGDHASIAVTAMADPVGTPGVPMTGALTIQTSDPTVPPLEVPVTLTTTGGVLISDQGTLDFGQVTTATAHSLSTMLTNTGNATISISAGPFADPAFSITSATTFSLAPQASQQVDVRFDPPMSQSYGYQLPLQVTGPTCAPSPLVNVTGVGSLQALLLDHTTLDFGSIACGAQSAAKTLTITNGNPSSYPYTASVTSGGTKFSVTPMSGTVPASGMTSMTVTRAAVTIPATTGMVTGTLHVVVTGPPNGTNDVALKYNVTGASVSASTTQVAFNSVVLNSSRSQMVTITNGGNQTANITVTRSGSTEITGPGSFQVPAGGMVQIMLTFAPTATGTVTASFMLAAQNLCSTPVTIQASGTGVVDNGN